MTEEISRIRERLLRFIQAMVLLLPGPARGDFVKLVADILQQLGQIALPFVELQLLLVQNILRDLLPNHSASSRMSKIHIIEMADKSLGVLFSQLFQIGSICSAGSRWFWNCVTLFLEPFQILLQLF